MTGWVEDLEQQMAQLTAAVMANSDELARVVSDLDALPRRVELLERKVGQLDDELAQVRRLLANVEGEVDRNRRWGR